MKRNILWTLAALMCLNLGCDTEIPSEEVADNLDVVARCGMSGGIPLNTARVSLVKKMRADFDDNANWTFGENGAVLKCDASTQSTLCNIPAPLQTTLAGVKSNLTSNRGGNYVSVPLPYNTALNSLFYGVAYKTPDETLTAIHLADDGTMYCACGTEICDEAIGCVKSDKGEAECAAYGKSADDNSVTCDPADIQNRYLAYILIKRLFPIIKQLSYMREMLQEITQNGTQYNLPIKPSEKRNMNLPTDLLDCEAYNGTAYNKQQCYMAQQIFAMIVECINAKTTDKVACYSYNKCNNDSTITDKSQCATQIVAIDKLDVGSTVPYAVDKYNYYDRMQKLVAAMIGMEDPKSKEVSDFIIEQALTLTQMRDMTASLTDLGKLYAQLSTDPPTPMTKDQITDLMKILREFLTMVYGKDVTGTTALHRQFFGAFITATLDDEVLNALAQKTFTVRKECLDHTSPLGDNVGIERYCHSGVLERNDSLNMTAISYELTTNVLATAAIADAMIMGHKYVINVPSANMNIGMDFTEESLYAVPGASIATSEWESKVFNQNNRIKGTWMANKCGASASCTLEGRCGECTNSHTVSTYSVMSSGGRWNTIQGTCENGTIIPSGTPQPGPGPQDGCTNGDVRCKDGYLEQCNGSQYVHNDAFKCQNGCDPDGKKCNIGFCSDEEKCIFTTAPSPDGSGQMIGAVMWSCEGGDISKLQMNMDAPCGEGSICSSDGSKCIPASSECSDDEVRCKDGYLEKCTNNTFVHNDKYKCKNGCNANNTGCENQTTCDASQVDNETCMFDYTRGMLGAVMVKCIQLGTQYSYVPTTFTPPCGDGAICNEDYTACIAP